MKRLRGYLMALLLLLMIGAGTVTPNMRVEAASLSNVMKAPKAKDGKWVASSAGYRYQYTATGKYAKSSWLKISGKIYYFKSTGYLQTGWKTYKSKKYYFDKTGVLQTGWKTIAGKKYYFWKSNGSMAKGKSKIAGSTYYFSSTGVMQTGWKKIGSYYYYFRPSNGVMAVSTTVAGYKVDSKGRRTTASSSVSFKEPLEKAGKVDWWVGDSRTVGLCSVKGISSKCIGKVGEGYSWWNSTAKATLKKKLDAKPTATVVLGFGINDIDNYSKYISSYKKLMQEYPKAKIYVLSVNPVDSKYTWGPYSCSSTKKKITTFNTKMKETFPARYIDCNAYLTKNGFKTADGVHYDSATYKKIYSYVIDRV